MCERVYQRESHSVAFALVKNGLILVEERLEPGKWQGLTIIPGGHIEEGETQEDAMIREVRDEEIGVMPTNFIRLGSVITVDDDLTLKIKHIFLIEEWDGEIRNMEGRNKQMLISLDDAKKVCTHPISQKALQMISSYLSRQN
jgi:mutator protein MutT